MSTTLKDYSPAAVAMSWAGIAFTGFAEDTFITVSRASPNTNVSVGADGSVGITKSADKTGTIEITLMQTSPTHRVLSAVQALQDSGDELYRAGMTIADPSGGFIVKAQNVHIQEAPEVSLGSDQNEKTWVFFAEKLIYSDVPTGFAQSAGEAGRIVDAVDGVVEVAKKLTKAIGG